ncbi:PREDICTED: uncharacterized protein LOC18600996 [Theobroma cacao]|uniref:Uncharacterized protein LOC18600996 n=1 Tax=Theobroma cacao TaxID=3641 RepID=A0AB32W8Q1_THECC|nr:PREDICTED: uncharacterized protein LOC18600996 [Theobroma cacao]
MQDCFVSFRFYFLFIVAEDSQALQYCKSRHPHCIHLKTFVTGKFDMIASGTQECRRHVAEESVDRNFFLFRDLNPHPEYQSVCNLIPNKECIDHFSLLQVQYFSEVKFGSLCKPCDLSQIFVVQATCCEKIESKIHHLKLVLDDWRNFTELSAKNASSKWSPSSWRAPQKCTG